MAKSKVDLCETCGEREATIFPMVVRNGKPARAKFCEQCYGGDKQVPRSLQDMIADLEGKPRDDNAA